MTLPKTINPCASIWRGRRVGLLGGSFNPAHKGHRMISCQALVHLGLDEVWWMVSPQNPLKSSKDMASLEDRLATARTVAGHPRIRVTDIERHLGTQFTAETLGAVKEAFPVTRFVWLMGADNMAQISRWKNWTAIFESVPVAVFGRPSYSLPAMISTAARRFANRRIPTGQARSLVDCAPPAWTFVYYRQDPISATGLRAVGHSANQGKPTLQEEGAN